jgi:3-oxoacyl-[acyl-carrier protein] reductase
MDLGLKDKVALVTGAGSPIGFGKTIALTLSAEGCNIIVNDVNLKDAEQTAAEISALGRKSMSIKADVSNKAEVDDMVKKALDKFGRIDILVNNAGIGIAGKTFLEMPLEEWDWMINVNIKGVLLCSRAVLPSMAEHKGGKIINMSSGAARMGVPLGVLYAATKAAVTSFTKSLAMEVAPMGINVNAILPGGAKTNLSRNSVPGFEERMMAMHTPPIGRVTVPQDIANMVTFLASDKASDITGQNIAVDGGSTMF